jgi:hypothetical protein
LLKRLYTTRGDEIDCALRRTHRVGGRVRLLRQAGIGAPCSGAYVLLHRRCTRDAVNQDPQAIKSQWSLKPAGRSLIIMTRVRLSYSANGRNPNRNPGQVTARIASVDPLAPLQISAPCSDGVSPVRFALALRSTSSTALRFDWLRLGVGAVSPSARWPGCLRFYFGTYSCFTSYRPRC